MTLFMEAGTYGLMWLCTVVPFAVPTMWIHPAVKTRSERRDYRRFLWASLLTTWAAAVMVGWLIGDGWVGWIFLLTEALYLTLLVRSITLRVRIARNNRKFRDITRSI